MMPFVAVDAEASKLACGKQKERLAWSDALCMPLTCLIGAPSVDEVRGKDACLGRNDVALELRVEIMMFKFCSLPPTHQLRRSFHEITQSLRNEPPNHVNNSPKP